MSIYPNLVSIWYSLTSFRGFGDPEFVGLANYQRLFADPTFGIAMGMAIRSLIAALGVALPVAFALAFLLSRQKRGSGALRFAYFLPVVIPATVIGLMWKFMFTQNGVINSALSAVGQPGLTRDWLSELGLVEWVVLVPDVWLAIGFYVIIFVAALTGIPSELYEAAKVDGASAWHELRFITLPMARGAYVAAIILALPGALGTFIYPYVMTTGGPIHGTYTLGLWAFVNVYFSPVSLRPPDIGYGSAIALIQTAIAVALGAFIWRRGRRNVVVG